MLKHAEPCLQTVNGTTAIPHNFQRTAPAYPDRPSPAEATANLPNPQTDALLQMLDLPHVVTAPPHGQPHDGAQGGGASAGMGAVEANGEEIDLDDGFEDEGDAPSAPASNTQSTQPAPPLIRPPKPDNRPAWLLAKDAQGAAPSLVPSQVQTRPPPLGAPPPMTAAPAVTTADENEIDLDDM